MASVTFVVTTKTKTLEDAAEWLNKLAGMSTRGTNPVHIDRLVSFQLLPHGVGAEVLFDVIASVEGRAQVADRSASFDF